MKNLFFIAHFVFINYSNIAKFDILRQELYIGRYKYKVDILAPSGAKPTNNNLKTPKDG